MKKNKGKIIGAIIVLMILVFSFFWGTSKKEKASIPVKAPVKTEEKIKENVKKEEHQEKKQETKKETEPLTSSKKEEPKAKKEETPVVSSEKEEEASIKTQSPEIIQEEPKTEVKEDKNLYCTISIKCTSVLNNLSQLDPDKKSIIPPNGIILKEKKVIYNENETAFDVILRETKNNKIHFEFSKTPAYNSIYIEGIGNLYEFDCGELSGWIYSVNGSFPKYSCSQYKLQKNDKIEFIYSCDLGKDAGNGV